jgi:hypothetical protein
LRGVLRLHAVDLGLLRGVLDLEDADLSLLHHILPDQGVDPGLLSGILRLQERHGCFKSCDALWDGLSLRGRYKRA